VLSVEEQYWSLWQRSSLCRTRATALAMAREAVERGEARVDDDRGTPRAVAVAAAAPREQIEHFRLEFESAAAERDEAESRLRKILGLEPSDHRRLVPATAPRTDDFYRELRVAVEARAAALALLEKERAGHMAGRITTEDYLDALERWCQIVAEDGRACVRYNRALALLDQDRGMVLDAANIAVSAGPKPRWTYARPRNTLGRKQGRG
jgi:hypothetical protein